MSVTISLTSKTEGYSNVSLAVSAGSEAENYAKLDKQLGLTYRHQAIVIDGEGAAAKLIPEGVNGSGYTFVVRERSDVEHDGTGDKWASGELDEHQEKLDGRFVAPRTKNAAMNAYAGKATAAPNTYFLDYNETLRASYLAGLSAQVPADFIATSTDENRVGGVPHEPTVGSVANDRTATLRWAYFLGLQNGVWLRRCGTHANPHVPTTTPKPKPTGQAGCDVPAVPAEAPRRVQARKGGRVHHHR